MKEKIIKLMTKRNSGEFLMSFMTDERIEEAMKCGMSTPSQIISFILATT